MTDETPPGGATADPHGGHRYEAAVMLEFPFLALAEGRTEDIRFPDKSGDITLLVTTERTKGMAFVSDVNILIWVITELRDRIRVRHEPRRDIVLSITRSKLLRYIGKGPGGAQHEDLASTLERLCATRVETNLPFEVTGRKVLTFWLLERCEPDDTDPTEPGWAITPPDWLIDVVEQDLIVRIHPDSMKLHGIPRCVYRYARARVRDALFSFVDLDPARAIDRFGSTASVPTMRDKLRRLVGDLERTKALRSGKAALGDAKLSGGAKPRKERQVIIPDYLVTPSATDGVTLSLAPEASTLGLTTHELNVKPQGLLQGT
ncbi:replication initiator protein A [Methylobacterium pseudosasicola]|uniref:Replication initiator protein A n=1 Tax=Methylobacterium pseudosasicola TaxID=582667 RepID=A0A1I4MNJ5_9HYPH|nr:replication initiator protein A [Methylobacterium pseudosasicola]SFM04942.1 Replication initiator protein A [Methylobacterium pseudosasicola]